jgi:SH3 domain protein
MFPLAGLSCRLSMRKSKIRFSPLLSLWLALSLFPALGHTAQKYITDDIEVMVRTGAGMQQKIIAMPRSGVPVAVLEELPSGWFKVRLPDGKEGWMVGRYLTEKPPAAEVISELKSENADLRQKLEALTEENALLTQGQDDLPGALSEKAKTAEGSKGAYEMLREKDPEFLALKAYQKKASELLAQSTRREAALEKKAETLESGNYLKWFLAGAGVLVLGFLIGFRTRRSRRRSSLH